MSASLICLVLLAPAADETSAPAIKAADKLFALHLKEAQRWRMVVDGNHKTEAVLGAKPVYVWTNPTRSGGQHGAVFLWTHGGRPVVVGSIFSHPEQERRMVCHEFHSLCPGELLPERGPEEQEWAPKASVTLTPLAGAPAPEESAARRLIQMRSLLREFTAHTVDVNQERWELRSLPRPLYRYDRPQGEIVDGALFAFVTSAGTDPEVILILEARKTEDGAVWFYRSIRFSDSNLFVQHEGKEIWTSIRDDQNQLHFNPDHTYRLIRDKHVDEIVELVVESPDATR